MADNESFASLVKNNPVSTAKSSETALITLERAQKLDLLIHLISNLRQSLVICGPKGIGKTTLLAELKQRKSDVWPLLTINTTSNLSFENIQEQIVHFVRQSDESRKNQEFSVILASLEKQNKKVVILFESSGQLVPGLISALIQYATSSYCLRFVFSLTHDELHIKTRSDQAIDNCHFIEIPPLTENQCGIFLQHLSRQANKAISFDTINERMIAKLYQNTHGIPGNIMSELSFLSSYSAKNSFNWGGLVFLAAMVTAGISFFIFNEQTESEGDKTAVIFPEPKIVDISSPVLVQEVILEKNNLSIEESKKEHEYVRAPAPLQETRTEDEIEIDNILNKPLSKKQLLSKEHEGIEVKQDILAIIASKETEKLEIANKTAIKKIRIAESSNNDIKIKKRVEPAKEKKSVPVSEKIVKNKKQAVNGDFDNDRQWILAQKEKDFTIQLMALSQRKSVLEVIEKNILLKNNLKYFKLNKLGKSVFVLIYGSFKSSDAAAQKMKLLPEKYRKSWIRRFEPLQKSINN